jgi:hypothetical protein
MSTSPIRQVFEIAGPSDLVNIQRPTAGGFSGIDASVPLASMLASGAYTPVVLATTYAEVPTIESANYSKVGSVVNCSIYLSLELDPTKTEATFTLSIPFTTNIGTKELIGIIAFDGDKAEFLSWGVSYDATNGGVSLRAESATTGYDYQYLHVMFQYLIV